MYIQGWFLRLFSAVVCPSGNGSSSRFPILRKPPHQQGSSLIEIMVTLVLVAIGLSGMMMMQVRGLEQNQSAYLQTQAIALASGLADRMRLNKQAALNDLYQLAKSDSAADFAAPAQKPVDKNLAYHDLNTWLAWVETALPNGDAQIARNKQVVHITLSWGGGSKPAGQYTHEIDLI